MREELGFDGTETDDVDYEAVFSIRPRYGMYVPHAAVDLCCTDPSMTRQEFADDADINTIMRRYESTGTVPGTERVPFYGDFTDMPDFMQAQAIVIDATDAFMSLPARVRREFDNNPAEFVKFASDPDNVEQMRIWGLAEPAKPVEKPLDDPKGPEAPKEPIEPAAPAGS